MILKWLEFVNKFLTRHLKRRGIQVTYWVINSKKDLDKAIKAGADCIMTD